MSEIRFERVTAHATKRGKCPECGKTAARSRTFAETINPFHPAVRDLPAGATQSDARRAVRESLDLSVADWEPSFLCLACIPGRADDA